MAISFYRCKSLVQCFFKPGVLLAGKFSYARKALISVLLFNLSLGAVAYFYMELQSARIARLEREAVALKEAVPKFDFVNRLVAGRFNEVLGGSPDRSRGVGVATAESEFKRLFPATESYPKHRLEGVVRQLSIDDTSGNTIARFGGYTGLLRIVISVIEDDLRGAGVLGDPSYGAIGDVIGRQFPLLIDNAAKQILVPRLPAQEFGAYASGAQLIVLTRQSNRFIRQHIGFSDV